MSRRKRKKEPPDDRVSPSASLLGMRSLVHLAISLGHSQRELQPGSFSCSWFHLHSSVFKTELLVPNPCVCDVLARYTRRHSSPCASTHFFRSRGLSSGIVERPCQGGQLRLLCGASFCSLFRGPAKPIVGLQGTNWWFMMHLSSTTLQTGQSVQISGLRSTIVERICRDGQICTVGITPFEWFFCDPTQPVEQTCVGASFQPAMGSCNVRFEFQLMGCRSATQTACWFG
uniref:Uncharacterized protein n=1 Tax=Opuntia streptacantha TaxID=393608 RepID=A0A7C8YWX2_OPUST